MPSSYAHYRFGVNILPALPADVRRPVQRYRALFDLGLQGPDIFFFHHFFKSSPIRKLGSVYHEQSGQAFFAHACELLRRSPAEDASAYLYGLLAHYCLDSVCHPFVYQVTDEGPISHTELEAEFDRYLLERDGCKKPHAGNISRSIRLTKAERGVVAAFYPEVSPSDVTRCVRNMAWAEKLLTLPTRAGNWAAAAVTNAAGGFAAGKVRTIGPNPACAHLNEDLMERFDQAQARFPEYLEQLNSHMAYAAPFGEIFTANFNRGS